MSSNQTIIKINGNLLLTVPEWMKFEYKNKAFFQENMFENVICNELLCFFRLPMKMIVSYSNVILHLFRIH